MDNMWSVGKHRAAIELDEVKVGGAYEKMDKRNVNEHTYDHLEREKKTQTENTTKKNMDKTKVFIVVLCVVVAALLVEVVAVDLIVYFGATDGGWTGWEDWGACNATCGVGVTTRIRTCSNPIPSLTGNYCDGTSVKVQTCGNSSCAVTDSTWTTWGDWGTCSVTCGGGLMARSRTCSNPEPSSMGKYCAGTSEQMKICNNVPCSGNTVGFSVYEPYSNDGGRLHPMIFRTAFYNNNDVFNMTSGEFVCQQEGLYFFTNTLLRASGTTSTLDCRFYKNDTKFNGYGSVASSSNADDNPSSTTSILYHLKPGDRVYLGSCEGMDYLARGSSFTGFLIRPEY